MSDPDRYAREWQLATGYLGLVPRDLDPALPEDTRWFPVDELPRMAFDHGDFTLDARERLRGKLSYTNAGFALAPPEFTLSELREIYVAALGHPVSATNLKRVLLRRGVLEPTGERRVARAVRRPARGALPLPHARARHHRSVRGTAAAALAIETVEPRAGRVTSVRAPHAIFGQGSGCDELVPDAAHGDDPLRFGRVALQLTA